jgi:two-component system, NarL family, nitrate/nitrite response regulator NarL
VALLCLIVDDSATFLDAATALLEREGVTVVGVASDGAQALARAKELHPDVVLLDIMLGRESGFDVAWRLADPELAGIAVILISTHVEADFEDLIEEAPVAGFVQKSDLSADAIRTLMDSHHEESGTRQNC